MTPGEVEVPQQVAEQTSSIQEEPDPHFLSALEQVKSSMDGVLQTCQEQKKNTSTVAVKYKAYIRSKYEEALRQLKLKEENRKLLRLKRELEKWFAVSLSGSGSTRFKHQLAIQHQQIKTFLNHYDSLISFLDSLQDPLEEYTNEIIEQFKAMNTTKTVLINTERTEVDELLQTYQSLQELESMDFTSPKFLYALNTLMNVRAVHPEKEKYLAVTIDGNKFHIKQEFMQIAIYQKHFIQGGGKGSLQDWFQIHVGYPGTGKTVTGLVWMLMIDDDPSLDKIAMRTEDIPSIVLQIKPNSVLIIDEGATALNAKEATKRENAKIEVLFSVMRQNKGLFVVINMTDFLLLARNVRGARARSLVKMKFDLDKLRAISTSVGQVLEAFKERAVADDTLKRLQLQALERAYNYRLADYFSMKRMSYIRKNPDTGKVVFPAPNFSGKIKVEGGPLFDAYNKAATEWKRKVETEVYELVKQAKEKD